MQRSRLIFLNALPLNAINLQHFCVDVRRVDAEFLRFLVREAKSINAEIISFIRHEATLNLINELFDLSLQTSSGLYEWREGDRIVVITLKKPVRGQEVSEVEPEDLEIFHVHISEVCY
jgi:hypothetical protein